MSWWSGETEISSPSTPLGTRVRTGAPVTELSTTSAPRVVTPAMAGGRAVVWLTGCARDVPDAFGVAGAEVCAAPVCPPPPHAATMVSAASAAGPASALSSAERSAGRIVMPPWRDATPGGDERRRAEADGDRTTGLRQAAETQSLQQVLITPKYPQVGHGVG